MQKTTNTLYSTGFFRVTDRKARLGGREHTYFVIDNADVVAILPITADNRLILERQFRPAISANIYEIPAGHIEKNEKPRHAALRELEEETGFIAGTLKKIALLYGSPGILNERMHIYIASDLRKGRKNLDPGEEIKLKRVSRDTAMRMIRNGAIRDAKTMAALLFYQSMLR